MKIKKVFVLIFAEDSEIQGIVNDEKFAQDWISADMTGRDYKEFELNNVTCEECKHPWKFKK